MKYAVEIVSSDMIYIPIFMKIGKGIQTFLVGTYIHRHTQNKIISYA
jgi:hypothetical protein